jgi:hypothetical protein
VEETAARLELTVDYFTEEFLWLMKSKFYLL